MCSNPWSLAGGEVLVGGVYVEEVSPNPQFTDDWTKSQMEFHRGKAGAQTLI